MSQSPREIVERAIKFQCPARLPVTTSISPAVYRMHGQKLLDLLSRYPNDFGWAGWRISDDGPAKVGTYVDEWGCTWQKLDAEIGAQPINPPLKDWALWTDYNLPDPMVEDRWFSVDEQVNKMVAESKYVLGGGGYLFERIIALRGFDNALMDCALEVVEFDQLITSIGTYIDNTIQKGVCFDVDGFIFGDDWGMQDRLFVQPDTWRRKFLPVYKRWFATIHKHNRNVHFHTDGNVTEILSDLAQMGADELNLQCGVVNIDAIASAFRGKVCLRGEPDRQKVLPSFSPENVRAYTKDLIEAFHTPQGGFIMSIKINHDTPWKNIVALFESLDSFL